MAPRTNVYFAERHRKEIGKALSERLQTLVADTHDNRVEMRNAYMHVFGRDAGYGITSGVTRGGDRGELAQLRVNSATATARGRHSIASSAKVTWKVQAKNDGSEAAATVSKGQDVLENEWKTKGLSAIYSRWTKLVMLFSEWFQFTEWDKSAGPALLASQGRLINQGDAVYRSIAPWNVFRDNSAQCWEDCQYTFVKVLKNRFDLVALHPQLPSGLQGEEARNAILQACDDDTLSRATDANSRRFDDTDLVPVWYFMHKPCATLPLGRMVLLAGQELVLSDEAIRGPKATYEGFPLYRMVDEEMVDSPHAWALYWDSLGAQEVKDSINTAMATRATTLSSPMMAIQKGSDLTPSNLGNGWRSWEYASGSQPPREVEFNPVQKELLEYDDKLDGAIRFIQQVNDVSLGQQKGSEMNAQAFAIMDSLAVRNASAFQENAVRALGEMGTGVLKLLSKRVVRERTVRGIGDKPSRYSGKDLANVDSVFVEIGNPMEQSAAGRLTITQDKMKLGAVVTAEQYDQTLATGRDATIGRTTIEMTLVQREKEMLLRGELPRVTTFQNHPLHYRENSAAGLETDDPAVLDVVMAHLDEHYLAMFQVPRAQDPLGPMRERWLLGMPPGPGQEQPMMPPGGAPGAAPPPAGPPPAGDSAEVMGPPEDMQTVDVPPVINPATGGPYDPTAPEAPAGALPQ